MNGSRIDSNKVINQIFGLMFLKESFVVDFVIGNYNSGNALQ